MFRKVDINKLHSRLESRIKAILGQDAQLRHGAGAPNWAEARPDTRIQFSLTYRDQIRAERALRERGGASCRRVDVFPLAGSAAGTRATALDAERVWVSWFEEWRTAQRDGLSLSTAGWTVFLGQRGVLDKTQILRADWDQLCCGVGDETAGQPHWHVDHEGLLRLGRRDSGLGIAGVSSGVTEATLPAQAGGDPVVVPWDVGGLSGGAGAGLLLAPGGRPAIAGGRVHLAMGAWNATEEHPRRWQRCVHTTDDLVYWSEATLLYLQDQIRSITGRKG